MSTRRSARIRAQPTQEPVEAPELPVKAAPKTTARHKVPVTKSDNKAVSKRKNRNEECSESGAQPAAKAQKVKAGTGVGKASKSIAPRPVTTTLDSLLSLPGEILNMILKNVDTKSLGRLSQTSKSYYALVAPQLYKRVDVYATAHAHIAKLIRTLDPLLSIEQRKQLKEEGTYKGQQESFSKRLDPKKIPELASFVNEAILGIGDPGKKHRYIVHRYVEEAMKNMKNLEIVETQLITESITNSLAEQKNLKALSLSIDGSRESDIKALVNIKGLSHLSIRLNSFSGGDHIEAKVGVSLILNSRSTLRSLSIQSCSFASYLLDGLAKHAKVKGTGKILTALESLSLTGAHINEDINDVLAKVIDLVALKQLKLGYQSSGVELMCQYIGDVLSTAHEDASSEIKLRDLSINMADDGWNTEPAEQAANLNAKIHLVSSFDTLTALDLDEFGQYPEGQPEPGIHPSLFRAILMHQDLVKLKMTQNGINGGRAIPHWQPHDVTNVITNLPKLKELEFSTSASNAVRTSLATKISQAVNTKYQEEIGRIISQARNLISVKIETVKTWAIGRANPTEVKSFLSGITHGVMERDLDNDVKAFKWEDHSALRYVTIDRVAYELGSKFEKAKKGTARKAEKFTVNSKPKREVLYREITVARPAQIYALDPTWVNQVAKDLGRA
ncbi:hypothetical protein ACHAQD_006492 [Fusarium lateritium]